MGQQQLLLVILVTIIVGIATVVAINIFGTAADQANVDAVRQDLMAAAVQAQAVWSRPTLMDGADRDFSEMEQADILARLNIPSTDPEFNPGESTTLENENGVYSIITNEEENLVIQGVPSSYPDGENLQVQVQRNDQGNWEVTITDTMGGTASSGTN